jgi:hypothetical protein
MSKKSEKINTYELYVCVTNTTPDTHSETYKRFCLIVHYVKTGNEKRLDDMIAARQVKPITIKKISESLSI